MTVHLDRLEAESIHIIRDATAQARNPVMLHLAMKAFHPAKPPFPLMHVDTTWKFREMIAFRDQRARELGLDLIIHVNEEGVRAGIGPFSHGSAVHTDVMKTEALKQALDKYGFDAAFGGARARPGRLHPDRQGDQRHRRLRHDRLRATPRPESPLAGPHRGQAGPCHPEGPQGLLAVVHRIVGGGKVHRRRSGGKEIARHGPPYLSAGRRQSPPRSEQGPGLHRRGPGGKHPPGRRGGPPVRRCRTDRAGRLFVDAPLAVYEQRDPKGLYHQARAGQLQHFTGVDSPYEPPENPELRLDAQTSGPMALADSVVTLLRMKGIIAG